MRHQIAARVPAATHASLRVLSAILESSQAEVLTRALAALATSLSPAQARAYRLLLARHR